MNCYYYYKILLNKRLMMSIKFIGASLLVLFAQVLFAQSIDIGIFKSTINSDQIDIKIKPDFDIADDETVTAILYTVRWNDPELIINTEFVFPFFLSPQGDPEEYNGYYYQVFAAVPVNALALMANQEFIASSFTFINGDCASFEIIEDGWTQVNNGNVYFEFLGGDVSGIIYAPIVNLGSVGGIIAGGGNINLGESTGLLTLSDFTGNINIWQRKIDDGVWTDLPSTSGLVSYSEIPTNAGIWFYRCETQLGECAPDYSEPAQVVVTDTITSISEGSFLNGNNIKFFASANTINLERQDSEMLKGIVQVYNLQGQKIFENNISKIRSYSFNPLVHGIIIITFYDESSRKLYKSKILLK